MFAPKSRQDVSNRREKPHSREHQPMPRSGSLLGTIKNIVSAPLSWFASSQEDFEDLGKRRRVDERDVLETEEGQINRLGKRMRVDNPEPPPPLSRRMQPHTSGGYLDPPLSSMHVSEHGVLRKDGRILQARRASIFGGSLQSIRTVSVSADPSSRYPLVGRDPASVPLPGSPVRSSPARSLGPDDDQERPRVPFRLRTSITTGPPRATPLRRESSAPPPLTSLYSHPTFLKPPPEEKQQSTSLTVRNAIPLGTLADLSKVNRREGTSSSLGRVSSISGQIASSVSTDAVLQPAKGLPQRTFQELELYKTPILPSRYKDATAIPPFLKPKRSHVPVPMKKREAKPSLGMAEKFYNEENGPITRYDGKPYAGKGNVKKLLARRRAEEEEEKDRWNNESTLTTVEEEDEMETDIEPVVIKRDVGVSAQMAPASEDERVKPLKAPGPKAVEVPALPEITPNDPFARPGASTPGGRQQPYGRVGRARNRDPGHRSVPLSRTANRFSAMVAEGNSFDDSEQDMRVDDDSSQQVDTEKARTPSYEVPKSFSFAADIPVINHDYSKAKEPPIPVLPVSISPKPSSAPTDVPDRPKQMSLFNPPLTLFPRLEPTERKKDESGPSAPSISIGPPIQAQPVKEANQTQTQTAAPSDFFAAPPIPSDLGSAATASAVSKAPRIPNFFANSPLLTGEKPPTLAPSKDPSPKPLAPTTGTAHASPMKDPDNPLWNGNDAAPSAPPKLFAQAFKSFDFGTGQKPGDLANAPGTAAAPPVPCGGPSKPTTPGTTEQQQHATSLAAAAHVTPSSAVPSISADTHTQTAPDKVGEAEKKPNGTAAPPNFNFGSSAASTVPKPLFGTGGSASSGSPFAMPAGQPQTQTGDMAPKAPTFAFGQPQVSDSGTKVPASQPSQTGQTGTTTERKSPFTFGAPSTSSATNDTSTSGSEAVATPKPLFGAPSGGGGFTFRTVPTAPSTEVPKPASPFAFGAPPATPPAGERQNSPFTFGTQAPASGSPATGAGFSFGTLVKQNGAEPGSSTPSNASPFTFGAQSAQSQRPVTPPSKPDEGMNMEESPVQMDTNGGQKKPAGSITFGLGPNPVNPFGQNASSAPAFSFGVPSTVNNPFASKNENKGGTTDTGGFNFNRTSSAPAVSTSFSFGAKPDQSTTPATAPAFGAPPNPFSQNQTTSSTSAPFAFGQQPSSSNLFGAPTHSSSSTGQAQSNPFSSAPSFNFSALSSAPSNPFAFGSCTPSSPTTDSSGLPQASSTGGDAPVFTFGASSNTGGSVFNIGTAPPSTGQSTPQRQIKKLPRRGQLAKR